MHSSASLNSSFVLLAALAGLFPCAAAPAAAAEDLVAADIRFAGTSTLHDFEGVVSTAPFPVSIRETESGPCVSATVRVSVADMTTAHETRDAKMCRMFQAETFSLIEGRVVDVPVPAEGQSEIDLLLKIRGVERPVAARVTAWQRDEDGLSFELDFPVSLKAFELKPPSVLGLIRVGDEVRIHCKVHAPDADLSTDDRTAEAGDS